MKKFITPPKTNFFAFKSRRRISYLITEPSDKPFKKIPYIIKITEKLTTKTQASKIMKFWDIIKKLQWRDNSEHICNINNIRNLTEYDINYLIENMAEYSDKLNEILTSIDLGGFLSFDDNDRVDILYHIIAKGKQFYEACLDDPEFCLYIITGLEFQPLLHILQNL